jgi:hypothetical protein
MPPFTPIHIYRGVARLSFTARIEGPPFYRGASASKKDGLATPPAPLSLTDGGRARHSLKEIEKR